MDQNNSSMEKFALFAWSAFDPELFIPDDNFKVLLEQIWNIVREHMNKRVLSWFSVRFYSLNDEPAGSSTPFVIDVKQFEIDKSVVEKYDVFQKNELFNLLPQNFIDRFKALGSQVWHIDFYNPDFQLKIINGRTIIHFEHCTIGIVQNYDSQAQILDIFENSFGDNEWRKDAPVRYTVSRLIEELKRCGQFEAYSVSYLDTNEPTVTFE